VPRRAWESHPGTASPTPLKRPSLPLCDAVQHGRQQPRGTVPPTHVRLTCRTIEKGRRRPRRGDERLLHTRTGLRRDLRLVGAVTSVAIGPVRPSPPSRHHPGTASPSPMLWKRAATGHLHAGYCALYGLTSTVPSSPHADGPRTGDLYAATLEAAPGHAQDAL
jgi:hypothetical protein